ncbi:MAG: hypothetical protein RL619_279 [Bacteroidota bacterium]|jgi:putative transposase
MSTVLRKGLYTLYLLICHAVFSYKYLFKVLRGNVKKRCYELIIQICESEGIENLKGIVSSEHGHMHIEYEPKQNISIILKNFKGRTSRKLQMEFSELNERY